MAGATSEDLPDVAPEDPTDAYVSPVVDFVALVGLMLFAAASATVLLL